MTVRWLSAFIDQPADGFDVGTAFWAQVSRSVPSSPRGDAGEFATLLPPTGDPCLRVQRIDDDTGGIHLDLHVDSIPDMRRRAEELGAALVADRGYAVMASPARFTFCLVPHDGESVVPDPVDPDKPHAVDQVCIDVPGPLFDDEVAFWSALTGLATRQSARAEFNWLNRPPQLPLRVLFQRLGDDDSATSARAHLDIACGDRVPEVAAHHEQLGATRLGEYPFWTAMADPNGAVYCLTRRDPATGQLSEETLSNPGPSPG